MHWPCFNPKNYPVTFGWHEELKGHGHVPDLPGTGMFHLQVMAPGVWRHPQAACGKLVSWGPAFDGRGARCHECRKVEESRAMAMNRREAT